VKLLGYLSDFMIPMVIAYIVAFGLMAKRPVYDDFVEGAKSGMKTVAGILPTLIGLMVGVSVLRASGFLDFLAQLLAGPAGALHIPSELMPMVLVRMFSASAANGLVVDLFREFGPDSMIGMSASLIMSSTETIFYTLSVYCMAIRLKKTRWTLAGAILAMTVGVIVSVALAGRM
jgi:spore maturation protein B